MPCWRGRPPVPMVVRVDAGSSGTDPVVPRSVPAPDPTCYVCAPSVTEPEVAPPGGEALYVLVHTPYLRDGQNWKGPYMKNDIPLDPWGNAYIYEYPGKRNAKSYDLMSMGPDGRAGGDDDISNWQQGNSQKR